MLCSANGDTALDTGKWICHAFPTSATNTLVCIQPHTFHLTIARKMWPIYLLFLNTYWIVLVGHKREEMWGNLSISFSVFGKISSCSGDVSWSTPLSHYAQWHFFTLVASFWLILKSEYLFGGSGKSSSSENGASHCRLWWRVTSLFLTFLQKLGTLLARLHLIKGKQSLLTLLDWHLLLTSFFFDSYEHCPFLSFVKVISRHHFHLGPVQYSEHFRWTHSKIESFLPFYTKRSQQPAAHEPAAALLSPYGQGFSWFLWNRHETHCGQ